MKWVFENKEHYADPFEVVETIYADFDYPEEISQFVRYMPSNQPLLDLVDFNKERLYKNWSDYLEKQKRSILCRMKGNTKINLINGDDKVGNSSKIAN